MALLILFFSGYNLAVPGEGWGAQLILFHGLYLHEALVIAYLLLMAAAGSLSTLLRTREAIPYASLVALLGALAVISSGINPYRLYDLGQAARLVLYAAQFLLAVHWCRTRGVNFVVRWYLVGIAVGGLLNLYYTFSQPYLMVGLLPALKARSGAGGMLALGIILAAWLFLIRQRRSDTIISTIAAIVGTVAVVVSFSKTSMAIGVCGLLAWLVVMMTKLTRRQVGLAGSLALAGLAGIAIYGGPKLDVDAARTTLNRIWNVKFAHFTLTQHSAESTRYMYNFAVAEIAAKHPLTGVGTSGFYDAIIRTDAYASGLMDVEDPDAMNVGGANPHNTFLFFASANGFPGLITVLVLFCALLDLMRRALRANERAGTAIWICLVLAYLVWAVTLPNLFTTGAMYFPAAAALVLVLQRRTDSTSRTLVAA